MWTRRCAVFLLTLILLLTPLQVYALTSYPAYDEQVAAAKLMIQCMDAIKEYRLRLGYPIDPNVDPNATGLIGDQFTLLTTSYVDLETKRTSTNPDFAALIVRYFTEAGLRAGDVVAVGVSGSYPALAIATLCAIRTLELEPIIIISLGSSTYGATLPKLAMSDMLIYLREVGLLPYPLAGISLGGGHDRGLGVLIEDDPSLLIAAAQRSGAPQIREETLTKSIARRMAIYSQEAGTKPIKCFVNVGAAGANTGYSLASSRFPNGLVTTAPQLETNAEDGLIIQYSAQGIPVIHLLNVRGLCAETGILFDPVPLPVIGQSPIYLQCSLGYSTP